MKKLHFIKPKLVKPKFFLGVPLALFSLEVYLGILLGYFLAKFFSGREASHQGIIKSFAFHIGNYRLHLHHWLLGMGVLISGLLLNFFPISPQFSYGFLGGLIFQGISSYPDWHKVLVKRKV